MSQKILIIDDDKDGNALIKAHFSKKGYEVTSAFSLDEGIDKLNEHVPDVLFLDHNLPDGLGWAMAGKFQKAIPEMKIILLTAFDAPPYPVSTTDADFPRLEKPFSLDTLDAVLAD